MKYLVDFTYFGYPLTGGSTIQRIVDIETIDKDSLEKLEVGLLELTNDTVFNNTERIRINKIYRVVETYGKYALLEKEIYLTELPEAKWT